MTSILRRKHKHSTYWFKDILLHMLHGRESKKKKGFKTASDMLLNSFKQKMLYLNETLKDVIMKNNCL